MADKKEAAFHPGTGLPHYPDVRVQVPEWASERFGGIGAVRRALRRAGVPEERIEEFTDEAHAAADSMDVIRRWVVLR